MPKRARLFPPYLNKGSRDVGNAGPVRFLQRYFIACGEGGNGLVADGDYGEKTAEVVKDLQRLINCEEEEVDGNFGPLTRKLLATDDGPDFNKIPADNEDCGCLYVGSGFKKPKLWPRPKRSARKTRCA